MRRASRDRFAIAILAIAFTGVSACSDDTTQQITQPSFPSSNVAETFTGTLTLHGAASFPFSTASGGFISATLTSFTPADTTIKVGLWIGIWDDAQDRCTFGVANDATPTPDPNANPAVGGGFVTASTVTGGTWCVRIYDAMGTVTSPKAFQIDLLHP